MGATSLPRKLGAAASRSRGARKPGKTHARDDCTIAEMPQAMSNDTLDLLAELFVLSFVNHPSEQRAKIFARREGSSGKVLGRARGSRMSTDPIPLRAGCVGCVGPRRMSMSPSWPPSHSSLSVGDVKAMKSSQPRGC